MWTNKLHHEIFLKICVEQVRQGNRLSGSLDKTRYENLIAEFAKQIGLSYTKEQFKNHWNKTRTEWQGWSTLRSTTGTGWDDERATYTLDDDHWTDFVKAHPQCEGLRAEGLQFTDLCDELFDKAIPIGRFNCITTNKVVSSFFLGDNYSNDCGLDV